MALWAKTGMMCEDKRHQGWTRIIGLANDYLEHGAWLDVADVVARVGSEGFERALFDWVRSAVPISVLFAFEIFDADTPGRVLLTEGSTAELTRRAMSISIDYAVEDHAVDEVFNRNRPHRPGQTAMLIQSGADRPPEFRLKYFDAMGSPQEFSTFGRNAGSTIYVGASSMPEGYDAAQAGRLRTIMPLVLVLIRKHAAAAERVGLSVAPAQREDTLRRMLVAREPDLTRREVEVCAAIVMGYRAEAVALRLGISPNTVATHRKRAYAKLMISSQTELFGLLFSGWHAPGGDRMIPG